jgi:hypothetical protein
MAGRPGNLRRRGERRDVGSVRVKMDGTKHGYARTSTDDQNPALQLAALKKAGCQYGF